MRYNNHRLQGSKGFPNFGRHDTSGCASIYYTSMNSDILDGDWDLENHVDGNYGVL